MPPSGWQQIRDNAALFRVAARAEDSGGFVERDIDFAPCPNGCAVDGNLVIAGLDFDAELAGWAPVHGDATRQDDLFTGTPRSDSSFRKEFLQADHGVREREKSESGVRS